MIITRTPLRISLFGGGTDYPDWFRRQRGSVIGFAIDKHVYVTAMNLSPVHPYRYRLYWRKVERAQSASEIDHPVVRAVLKRLAPVDQPLGFSIIADLPARSGLGSSSAFTVGFLNAFKVISRGERWQPHQLATAAVEVERDWLNEDGGWQDQFHCAYGGLNRFDFYEGGYVAATQLLMNPVTERFLSDSLYLISCGDARNSWEVNGEQIRRTIDGENDQLLERTLKLVDQAEAILMRSGESVILQQLGELLNEGWALKKQMSSRITTPEIDALYERALKVGALGGKLCGAGGGGFLAVIVPPQRQIEFRMRIGVPVIPVAIEPDGSLVVSDMAVRYE